MDYNLNGLELVKKAILRQAVPRIPWVPFVGVHAAALIGKTAREYLNSADLIVSGVSEAIKRYNPDGIPVVFDLQVEAEALGCELAWADDNPPAVVSHPLAEGKNIVEMKIPCACKGRIPILLEATQRLRDEFPGLALYGLVTGPFTLALHLLGTDIFMKMFEDPEYVHKVMKFTTAMTKKMSELYIQAGCDVIAMVDPMTSQIDPGSFDTFVSPYASDVFRMIREHESLSSFFVCGNAQHNIQAMASCKPDNISIDENIPLDYVRDTALAQDVSFGGNIKLTVSLLMGSPEDVQRDALACMDTGGMKGFILAPGCDLPMNTPPGNILAVTELVHDELLQGELRASEAVLSEFEPTDLSGHWDSEKVVIDVVTLDSSSCAPCQYMMNAVSRAAEAFDGKVIFREYRIKDKEGIQMMQALGVQKIPTIVIDGTPEFVSQIPPVSKIGEKISEYLKTKAQ